MAEKQEEDAQMMPVPTFVNACEKDEDCSD